MTPEAGGHPDHPRAAVIRDARRELRAPRAAGVAGILFAALFTVSMVMLRAALAGGQSTAEVERRIGRGDIAVGAVALYLVPFCGIAFLWFVAVVRDRIGDREDRFFATVFLGSGLLFVAMLFAGAAAAGGLLVGDRFSDAPLPDSQTVGLARTIGYSLLMVYAVKMAGVFTISTSTIMARATSWPRWASISGYVCALVMLFSVTFNGLIALVFPAWVTAVSCYVLVSGHDSRPIGPAAAGGARRGDDGAG